jgi:hypothetical protein
VVGVVNEDLRANVASRGYPGSVVNVVNVGNEGRMAKMANLEDRAYLGRLGLLANVDYGDLRGGSDPEATRQALTINASHLSC